MMTICCIYLTGNLQGGEQEPNPPFLKESGVRDGAQKTFTWGHSKSWINVGVDFG